MDDARFLSGQFLEVVISKDKSYLQHYFVTEIQNAFLKYVYVFGDWKLFVEHTGRYCSKRMLQALHRKLRNIEQAHRQAKGSMDLDTLEAIESGRYRGYLPCAKNAAMIPPTSNSAET